MSVSAVADQAADQFIISNTETALPGIELAQAGATSGAMDTEKVEKETTSDNQDDVINRWHGILSNKVGIMGESADRLFDSGIKFNKLNQTSIRFRVDADAIDGASELDGKLKIKLVLPAMEGRFRVLLNSNDNEIDDDLNISDPIFSDEDNGSAALDYSIRSNEKWRLSVALGARSDQGYGRFNLNRKFDLGKRWKSRIRDRLTYFSKDGWENDFRIDFDRTLGRPLPDTGEFRNLAVGGDRRSWLFRSATQFRTFEDVDSSLYEQRFSLFNRLSRYSAVSYEALAYGCTDQNLIDGTEDCRQYNLRVRYKRILPKYNWLAFELWPIVSFPESDDYEANAQLKFRMEIWFGYGRDAQGGGALKL
jgi:hypothetical protein